MGVAPWGITPDPENLLVEDWYANWFGLDYIRLYPHRDTAEAKRQVDFLLQALPEPFHQSAREGEAPAEPAARDL